MTHHGPAVVGRAEAGNRCDHDLLPGQCAPCKGVDLDDAPAGDDDRRIIATDTRVDVYVDRTFRSIYDGRCQIEPDNPTHVILAGDIIGLTDHGYACRLCVQALS